MTSASYVLAGVDSLGENTQDKKEPCGSSVSTSTNALQLADLPAVAIDKHLAVPVGDVPLGLPLVLGHRLNLLISRRRRGHHHTLSRQSVTARRRRR